MANPQEDYSQMAKMLSPSWPGLQGGERAELRAMFDEIVSRRAEHFKYRLAMIEAVDRLSRGLGGS